MTALNDIFPPKNRQRRMLMEKLFSYMKPKYGIFIITAAILLGVKIVYRGAGPESFRWLLVPVVFWVELFTGQNFTYSAGEGYMNYSQTVLINHTCSGLNFFILTILLSLLIIPAGITTRTTLRSTSLIITVSYILTVIANTIRIVIAIRFEPIRRSIPVLAGAEHWVHQGIGVFVFLSFLLIYYSLLKRGILWNKHIIK